MVQTSLHSPVLGEVPTLIAVHALLFQYTSFTLRYSCTVDRLSRSAFPACVTPLYFMTSALEKSGYITAK